MRLFKTKKGDKSIADLFVEEYFPRAYDIATGTRAHQRMNAAQVHAVETFERNATPHVGLRQRARALRQIASGYLRAENGLRTS